MSLYYNNHSDFLVRNYNITGMFVSVDETKMQHKFLISKFHHVLNVACFLLGRYLPAHEDGTDSVLKRRHIKFRRQGITQKKAYSNISFWKVTQWQATQASHYLCNCNGNNETLPCPSQARNAAGAVGARE